jgi:hypothetical protein
LDFTIGSALDIFGGTLEFEKIANWCKKWKMLDYA